MSVRTERVCGKCGEVNILTNKNVIQRDLYTVNDDFVRVTYYRCKGCGGINVVQLDSMQTIHLLRDFKRLLVKVAKKRQNGETATKKEVRDKNKLIESLRLKREYLKQEFDGLTLYDKDKNIFIEHLTLSGKGDIIESNM